MSYSPENKVEPADGDNDAVYQSDSEPANTSNGPVMNGNPKGQKTMQRTRNQSQFAPNNNNNAANQQVEQRYERVTGNMGGRDGAIRESRIKDRPVKEDGKDSVKVKIELDLEVEVDLYARVKGDVTIGLM